MSLASSKRYLLRTLLSYAFSLLYRQVYKLARFSRVPKSFPIRKTVAKSQTLWLRSCFIYIFLKWPEVFSKQRRFRRVHLSAFRYKLTKNMAMRAGKVSGPFEKQALAIQSMYSCPFRCFPVRLTCSLVHSTFVPRISPFLLYLSIIFSNLNLGWQLNTGLLPNPTHSCRGSWWLPLAFAVNAIMRLFVCYNVHFPVSLPASVVSAFPFCSAENQIYVSCSYLFILMFSILARPALIFLYTVPRHKNSDKGSNHFYLLGHSFKLGGCLWYFSSARKHRKPS